MSVRRLDFVPLRTRSPYSMLEGALKIKPLAARCADWRYPAIGLADTNNLCGALEFSETITGFGLQPIIGVTLSMDIGLPLQPGQLRRDPDGTLVLFAQNEKGYENLMALSSSSFLDVEPTDVPHVKATMLEGRTEGVIALTGGPDGVLNRFIVSERPQVAKDWLERLQGWFPDRLYLELQRHHTEDEEKAEPVLIDWAYDRDLPLVATNEPFYLDPEMHEAHDALLAISEGSYVLEKNRRKVTGHHYLKSPEQMLELFADLPEAIENTLVIAQRCAYKSPKRDPILPNFGDGSLSEADILAQQAKDGLRARLEQVEMAETEEAYFERLDFELNIIQNMGFPGYFLIVADFIKWAKDQGIPVGPGRGSGAGSVVAWALTITDLDPLRYGLLFERFLNPERVSMPDFDIDFCQERRGEVIDYVRNKYGDGQVAQIITFGTLQARAVVRDVGRVMQMPLGQVDRLAKLVPSNPANPVTLAQAINMEPALQDARKAEASVRALLDTALQLEGLYRNASTHAAGVVIGDRPSGMRDVLRKMAPSSIEELTALISLYRPGPMKNIPDYVDRKFERQEITYPHPKLKTILEETYGIIIYQEQVMEIAKVLSGFTLGDADLLRRAMGKKDQAEMDRQKSKFIDGAVERGVDGKQASDIFDLVNEFAGYGFNKSHAAAYAMISFQTAYLKALHPVEFIAAIMSLDINNVEKLAQFYQEGKRMGLEIMPPCVNRSFADFDVADGKVLYALGALKNVGVDAMQHVVDVRKEGGPFKDLYDFSHRVDMRLVNKRAIENLAKSGAFDCLEPNRATVLASASILQDIGTLAARERASSQVSLFGDTVQMEDPDLKYAPSWGSIEGLNNELNAVGFYLGGHPLDEHEKAGALSKCTMAVQIDEKYARSGRECKMNLAGVVLRKQERLSKRGKKFAFVALSDPTGEYEVLFTEHVLMANREYLSPGNLIQLKVKAEGGDGEVRLFAEGMTPFNAKPPETKIVGLDIRLRNATVETLSSLESLLETLKSAPYKNSGFIRITAPLDSEREACWKLEGRFGVDPNIQKAIKSNSAIEIIKEVAA